LAKGKYDFITEIQESALDQFRGIGKIDGCLTIKPKDGVSMNKTILKIYFVILKAHFVWKKKVKLIITSFLNTFL